MASFLKILNKLFGNKYDKDIKVISPIVKEINQKCLQFESLSIDNLRDTTKALKKQIKRRPSEYGVTEAKDDKNSRASKMTQLFRMGLAKKGELEIMKRAMKRGPDALKDPKLRTKLYELLDKIIDIVTTDGQIFVKLRQNVQNNKDQLQAVEELFKYMPNTVVVQNIEINKRFEELSETINTPREDTND